MQCSSVCVLGLFQLITKEIEKMMTNLSYSVAYYICNVQSDLNE